jgi:hypothetical protein
VGRAAGERESEAVEMEEQFIAAVGVDRPKNCTPDDSTQFRSNFETPVKSL